MTGEAPAPRVTRTRRTRNKLLETPPETAPAPTAQAGLAPASFPEDQPMSRASQPAMERPPLRTDLRVDPRAAAAERAAQILEHLGGVEEGSDEYYVDPKTIPDGWSYEWKRETTYGLADPSYTTALQRMGWTPVPADRHPEMMPKGWKGGTITRKGQILMERPKMITDMITQRNQKIARDQVRVKEQQLSSAPQNQMPRSADSGGDQRTAPKVSRSYEPMPVPQDK